MKKIFLFLLLYPLMAFSAINECKTDVYFANGILTEDEDAYKYTFNVLKPAIIDMLGTDKFTQTIGKVDYSYNETHGGLSDGIETVYQKFGITGLSDLFGASHGRDIDAQITAYKASINAGHKILVVAHSQGNLFTYDAYNALSSNMQKDFEAVTIASPMSADIKYGTTRIDWDNDIVPRIATAGGSLPWMTPNNVRRVNWESNNVFGTGEPASNYTVASNIGKIYTNGGYNYLAKEAGIDIPSKVHAFTFYMGQPLGIDDGAAIRDPFTNAILVETAAKAKIMQAISTKLGILGECKCSDANNSIQPENGIIEIALSWGKPNIRMSLSSAIGTKDIVASECGTFEHYYVKTEDDVSPGRYAVNVSNAGDVDESSLPESVNLSIHTPGAAMTFDFNITAVDMLNLGHVADIIITEDKKSEVVPMVGGSQSTNGASTVSCYGECKVSEYTKGTYIDYLYEIQSTLKQALLGPLSDADITLTKAEGFINNVAFYESSTSGGNSLLTSGIFYFTNEVLNNLEPATSYVISVIGGDDIDADDNGILDVVPTHNLGNIHAVIQTNTLKNENFKVNILTEIAFQLTKEMMNEELNATALQEKLDDIAGRLLIEDVDGNEEIDYKDVLAWVPIGDKEKLRKPYDAYYEPIVQKIYKDEDIYDASYDLAYKSYFKNGTFYVDENTAAGTSIGKLSLELVDEDVTYYVKEDNEFFDIAMDGNITLKSGTLDYETQQLHTLNVFANVDGVENSYTLNIYVNNIIELPVLASASFSISISSIEQGLPIGTIPIKVSDGITQIILEGEGSELFNVDKNGTITAKDTSYGHSVILQAYAINTLGESERVIINIIERIISSLDTQGYAWGVTLSADGTKAYVADGYTGLQIVDISNPTAPTIIGSIDTAGYAWDVTLSADGTKAYVADSGSGLQIIDISNPTAPTIIGSVDTPYSAFGITLSADGTKAYVTAGYAGLLIIDISNSTAATIIGFVNTLFEAKKVTLSADETKAFMVDEIGLKIIDISNPTTPTIIGSVDIILGYMLGVTLSADGTKAYLADGDSGLQIVDISDPTAPTIISSIDTAGYAYGVTLSTDGTKAYVANGYSGLQIVDISNPTAPIIIGSVDTPDYAWSVTLSADGTKAFVADGSSGLQIIDLTGF